VIRAYKFGRNRRLGGTMAELMLGWIHAEANDALLAAGTVIVPIPSSRRSARKRGFHSAAVLAQALSRATGLECRWMLSQRGRTAQKSLTLDQRHAHAKASLHAAQAHPLRVPPRVLLVDDVLTTGATVSQSALILKELGVTEVRALLFAMEY